jgi:hypothetical protein
MQFYFVRKFDVSPFVGMPLSVMPQILSQIKGDNKQSTIFRFLQCIPKLCCFSERISAQGPSSKGQRVGLVQNNAN